MNDRCDKCGSSMTCDETEYREPDTLPDNLGDFGILKWDWNYKIPGYPLPDIISLLECVCPNCGYIKRGHLTKISLERLKEFGCLNAT